MLCPRRRFAFTAAAFTIACGDAAPVGQGPDAALDASEVLGNTDTTLPETSVDTGPTWGLDERPPNPTCLAPPKPPVSDVVGLVPAYPGATFTEPTAAAFAPGGGDRIYVAGKEGVLWWAEPELEGAPVALDLTDRVVYEADMGLVGLAFDPEFAVTGAVYVAYNLSCEAAVLTGSPSVCPAPGQENGYARNVSRIARFRSDDGGDTFDPESEEIILDSWQPGLDHTVNQLVFGPDGFLYVGAGDGGCCGDPLALGQDLSSLRGKILRVAVDPDKSGYTVPADNPFVQVPGARPEIWALGLRNPWKLTFDRQDGSLWVGDVGQDTWEEVNRVEKGGNYGWNVVEGPACYGGACDPGAFAAPVAWYAHDVGKAIIGGFVYRGTAIPALAGAYLFGDYLGRQVWGLWPEGERPDLAGEISGPYAEEHLFDAPGAPVAFIEDPDGEPLLLTFDEPGTLYRLTRPEEAPGTPLPKTLSATGCVDPLDPTSLVPALIPYAPAAPFWSDGGGKDRYLALPDGASIAMTASGDFELPPGSVLLKEFTIAGRRLETRFYARHDDGSWSGYTYRWRADQSDADLVVAATELPLDGLTWQFPSRGACAFCHTAAAGRSLGLEARQLDVPFTYPATGRRANQLETLRHLGLLGEPSAGEVARFLRAAPAAGVAENTLGGPAAVVAGDPAWRDGALQFGGEDALETAIVSRGVQTVSAFVRPDAPVGEPDGEAFEMIIDSEIPGASGTGFGLDGGSVVALLDDYVWETDVPLEVGRETHVALTWDDRRARLYLDGALVQELEYTRGGVGGARYVIGRSTWTGVGFRGALRDVRIIDATIDGGAAALLNAGERLEAPPLGPAYADPYGAADTTARARAWLHTNCAQCHQPGGPGRYDLRHDTPLDETGMCEVLPRHGEVGAAGGRLIAPGAPERSVLVRRIRETGDLRMPPVSSHVVDTEGALLIESWISSMSSCND